MSPTYRQEGPKLPPQLIVINKYSDEQLRDIVKRMRERTDLFKEKVIDQYASSPEHSPPVSKSTDQECLYSVFYSI